jgi:MFS family permease
VVKNQSVWAVVIAAAVAASMAMGIRQTFGLFLLPLGAETGISLVTLGLAVALHNLTWGLAQPITGALGDRYGAGRVAAVGGLLYAAGLGLVAIHPSPVTVLLGIGIMTGLGVGCAGTGSVIAAVGRAAPPERRGSLLGIAAAGGSVGQALLVPYAQIGMGWFGAVATLGAMALMALFILPAARVPWRRAARCRTCRRWPGARCGNATSRCSPSASSPAASSSPSSPPICRRIWRCAACRPGSAPPR